MTVQKKIAPKSSSSMKNKIVRTINPMHYQRSRMRNKIARDFHHRIN